MSLERLIAPKRKCSEKQQQRSDGEVSEGHSHLKELPKAKAGNGKQQNKWSSVGLKPKVETKWVHTDMNQLLNKYMKENRQIFCTKEF